MSADNFRGDYHYYSVPHRYVKHEIDVRLANQVCRQGQSALYVRTSRLLDDLRIARADGSYAKKLAYLAKLDLLTLDDWGLEKLNRAQAQDVLELIDDRHGAKSLLITSQLPIEHWHESLGDPTLPTPFWIVCCNTHTNFHLKASQCEKRPKT